MFWLVMAKGFHADRDKGSGVGAPWAVYRGVGGTFGVLFWTGVATTTGPWSGE